MSHSAQFADHFARLTSLLVRQSDDVDDQKQQLMGAVSSANALPVLLIREGDLLLADGAPISKSTIYTMVLVDRMKSHNLVRLEVNLGPSAADVLGLARILAGDPAGGGELPQQLSAMRATTLRVEVAAPPTATRTSAAPAETPHVAFDAFEMLSEDQMRSAIAKPALKPTTATTTPPAGIFAEFSGPKAGVTMEQLLRALDAATDIGAVENVLAALPPHIQAALDTGQESDAVIVAQRVARRLSSTIDEPTKKLISHGLRRMMTAKLIAAAIKQLPGAGDRIPTFVTIFQHAGDSAIETLADRLAESEVAKERRAIFNVLVQLKAGVPLYIHMLGDRRWFVVRNAADLLAQMGAPEAEEPLIRALDSSDTRARRSVITALGRYNSPKAQGSIRRALQDPTAEVRLAAANGVGRTKNSDMTSALIEVLGREQDGDVQKALLGALGRQATEAAIKRLTEAAAPELFKRKSAEFRAAAVRALRDAGTGAGLQAARSFADDKEQVVRDAATKRS